MSNMQSASATCDSDTSIVALFAPKVSAIAASPLKLVINGVAYPLVTCSDMPSSAEKMKNSAIFFCLNRRKAFSPRLSATVCAGLLTSLHCGSVMQ